MTYPQRDSSSLSSRGSHRLICEMSVWFFWFFRRSAATEEARSGRAAVSDARRPRNRENGDDALTRAADARPRGREWGGALAVPLRDLRRSATRRGEKTRATGEAFGVDARRRGGAAPARARTLAIHASRSRPFPMTARARLATTRVPRARRPDRASGSAARPVRASRLGCVKGLERRDESHGWEVLPHFTGHCARRPKQTRDKLGPIVGIIRDASETYSTLLTHAPSHDIRHENPLPRTPY